MLAAASDRRVKALCLLDPVDFADAAPIGPGYPSAVQALKDMSMVERPAVPVVVIGSGSGGDCVPKAASYRYAPCVSRPAGRLRRIHALVEQHVLVLHPTCHISSLQVMCNSISMQARW